MNKGAFYDSYDYRAFWQGRDYEWNADKFALERLLGKVKTAHELLVDVGCGFGRNAPSFAEKWKRAVLVDPSGKNLEEARRGLKRYRNLRFVKGKAERLPLKDGEADTIICVRVFHHITNPELVIGEFKRILVPGGYLILEIANKRHAKAVIQSFFTGKSREVLGKSSIDRRSALSVQRGTIDFINHHPGTVREMLKRNRMTVVEVLSVSNFRGLPILKLLPMGFQLRLEAVLQTLLAGWFFGPSIYFLARKA